MERSGFGIRTIYARIGDAFAWLCVAGLAVALAMTMVLRIPVHV